MNMSEDQMSELVEQLLKALAARKGTTFAVSNEWGAHIRTFQDREIARSHAAAWHGTVTLRIALDDFRRIGLDVNRSQPKGVTT